MTSSSDKKIERGLEAMIIVYSLLQDHPASSDCEQFIRSHTGWLTTTFTLFEAKAILTKVYGVSTTLASQKLTQFVAGPIIVTTVDSEAALDAMDMADTLRIDLTDAVLLQAAQAQGATHLVTDDVKLAHACQQIGINPETPIDAALRQRMAVWEAANLPMKGLPRLLRQIHQWLNSTHPAAAQDFWSQTGGGSHLP